MEKGKEKMLPDGYVQIDEVIKDISSLIHQYNNDIMLVRLLNQLISKLTATKEIINYNPRLPLYQIDKGIIEMCKGKSYHGVNVQISFITKYPMRDFSNFCSYPVNI